MMIRSTFCLFAILLISATASLPASAQDSSIVGELERLRRDMNTLQSYVFRGEKKGAPLNGSAAFSEFASQDAVSQLQLQVQEMRRQLREMNGRFEEIQFEVKRASERLDRLVSDVDLRLRALEEGGGVTPGVERRAEMPPAAPGAIASRAPTGTTVISSSAATVAAPDNLAPGQQPFGVISKQDLTQFRESGTIVPSTKAPQALARPASAPGKPTASKVVKPVAAPSPPPVTAASRAAPASGTASGILPQGTPKQQYDYAYGLLMKRDLPNAEVALKEFLDRHPKDELADNAIFWLGETYYARKSYQEAIRVYYDAYKTYPKGNKAPAVLLKLGMSLAAIGEKESACSAYAELRNSHPDANPRILGNAARASKSLDCK